MKYKHILFDMDNTLYPASSAMNDGITRRMLECVADFFGCDMEKAIELRRERIIHYSTTLEWLRSEGMTDVEGFMAHVHPDNEADELLPQPGLRDFLLSLPLPMSVLTNAPHEHADRVLEKLGIADLFIAVTDIRDANFFGKPYPDAFEAALRKAGSSVQDTLFLDDMQKYTDGWAAMGGTAVLIGKENGRPLSADAVPMVKARAAGQAAGLKPGKTLRLNSIYEMKGLLNE
ncbi:MAG: HAD-IA family hydrolase [Treponema sp.]|nr:HAD-IA family hydrolase [Treponema sp.]